jgi:hypothetical protein
MPPPAHLAKKPARRTLKRCRWRELDKRLADERASFQTPLNDLSFDDRNIRVRILMKTAYRMGRRDQRDVEKLRRAR